MFLEIKRLFETQKLKRKTQTAAYPTQNVEHKTIKRLDIENIAYFCCRKWES